MRQRLVVGKVNLANLLQGKMKQGSNNRRSRSRGGGGGGKRHGSVRSQTFESNGPGVKVRGTAQQVLDKYLVLARDASSAGDRILAESCFQYAEHYYRVLNADDQRGDQRKGGGRQSNRPVPEGTPAGSDAAPEEAGAEETSEREAEVVVANTAKNAGGEQEKAEAEAPDAA